MHRIVTFFVKQFPLILFIVLEGIAISLLVNHNQFHRTTFQKTVVELTGKTYSAFNSVLDYFSLKNVNRDLASENAMLRDRLKGSFLINDRNIFIYNDTVYKQQFQYQNAKVVYSSVTKKKNYLILDKGEKQGIKTNMGVFAKSGVIGIVKSVSPNFSLVIPIINIDANIAARLKNNYQKGVVSWDGKHYSEGVMKGIPGHVELNVGDTIITGGTSIFFPEGLHIGYVKGYKRNPGDNFYRIRLNFSADFNSLNYVYIIRNQFFNEQFDLLRSMEDE